MIQLLSCMVRVSPVYRSLAQGGWWYTHSDGFQTTVAVDVADQLNAASNLPTDQDFITCHRTHQSHPFGVFYGENPLNYAFTLLLLEITLLIVITRIIRFLLKPLKQPRIVSEIIGGIIIGPSVLGRNKKFSTYVFPENAEYVFRNIGIIGLMYFLFVIGVKMDLSLVKKSGRKLWYIALAGVICPLVIISIVAFIMRKSMDKDLAKITSIGAISSSMAITSFHVLYPILQELNLLSSEVGRMSLSTSIICDAIGINVVYAFEAAKQGETRSIYALWYFISLVILLTFFFTIVRRGLQWIIDKTPEGQPVDQSYVVTILLAVLMMGFLTDMLGIAVAVGPLMLGLVIPDGPPLGATLVERSETIVNNILLPFTYAFIGLYTDVFSMCEVGWSHLSPLFALILTGYLSKWLATLITSLFLKIPFRDGLTFSFIMSLRGQMELLLYMHWMEKVIIRQPGFTLLVLSTLVVTATSTFFISILYDPTKPYMVSKRRTIQHTRPEKELRIVLCIHDHESVSGLINLLEVSNPSTTSPFSIFAVHLIELVGRAAPLFIDHEEQELPSKYAAYDTVLSALKLYQESRAEFLKLHTFTVVSPKRSMYQDLCKLALENKATFIILPFHKERLDHLGGTELVRAGIRSLNMNVLTHAPCSVGVLVDKGHFQMLLPGMSLEPTIHHFAVLFLGGPDAREALVYADRMAGNQFISLTVIRFLSQNSEGDDEMEKKLDDGLVTWFWVKNETNNRVAYREVVVRNGAETVAAIQALNDDSYNLWIVGRKHGINPILLEGLTGWSENQELGVMGDYLASVDFCASVLVVQQQIMRGNVKSKAGSQGLFTFGFC